MCKLVVTQLHSVEISPSKLKAKEISVCLNAISEKVTLKPLSDRFSVTWDRRDGKLINNVWPDVPPREGVEIPVVLASEKRKSTECKKYRKLKLPKVFTPKLQR